MSAPPPSALFWQCLTLLRPIVFFKQLNIQKSLLTSDQVATNILHHTIFFVSLSFPKHATWLFFLESDMHASWGAWNHSWRQSHLVLVTFVPVYPGGRIQLSHLFRLLWFTCRSSRALHSNLLSQISCQTGTHTSSCWVRLGFDQMLKSADGKITNI